MTTQNLILDTNCFEVASVNRAGLPYIPDECNVSVVEFTSSREPKFTDKLGSFIWRTGIELGVFPTTFIDEEVIHRNVSGNGQLR